MTTSSRRALIIGAGIGGLTAAIALRNAGLAPVVYERASALHPVGAGLTLQPNAVLALREIGIGSAIERAGAALSAGAVMRSDGTPLMKMPDGMIEQLRRELGAGIVGIHRATLHRLLLDALGQEHVQLGRACIGFRDTNDEVFARFADASEVACDVLIGADGIHSAIRAQLHGANEPRYAGYTSYRGVTSDRRDLPADFGGEMWGRGQRFGGCAIDGGRFYWFATLNSPAGHTHASAAEQKAFLQQKFASFGMRVPELIASTPEAAIVQTDISDRPTLSRWGRGAVTLLGDAAHAMTPNLGQGACQAIEDALVLSRKLTAAASIAAGLRAYEDARHRRANAVVTTARRLGMIGQLQHPLACTLRDAFFSRLPASATKRQLLDAWRLPA